MVIFVLAFGIIFSFSLLICLSATVLKLLLCITSLCFTVPSAVQSLYTDHLLLPLLELTISARKVQKICCQNLDNFFLVSHLNSVSYTASPTLPLTVRAPIIANTTSTPITKTVNAFIDTGSNRSFISAALVRELNLAEKPDEVIHYADDVQVELVDVEVSKYQPEQNQNHQLVSAQFTPIRLERTSIVFNRQSEYSLTCSELTKIGRLVDISVVTVAGAAEDDGTAETDDETADYIFPYGSQLMIGTDLIPSLLMAKEAAKPRVIPITSNLNAVETRLGYYLQGTQYHGEHICKNFLYHRQIWYRWKA